MPRVVAALLTGVLTTAAPVAAYSVIHVHSPEPGEPQAPLVADGAGNLYGTTRVGGSPGAGTVFAIREDGTGFRVLHTFMGGAGDGRFPVASLTLDGAGNLYGTTHAGGPSDGGTVFMMRTDGTGFRVLRSFTGGPTDGGSPEVGLVLDGAGNLYGATSPGALYDGGTVFKLKTDGTSFAVLHTFKGGATDGNSVVSALVLDGSGTLYGTTFKGGTADALSQRGTVFALRTDGTGFALLHSFAGGASDGKFPVAGLVLDGAGNLYGTTDQGGVSDAGTVFRLGTDGTGFVLLHSFSGGAGDGRFPEASLVLGGAGSLYGTTRLGGSSDAGTVFTLETDGTGFALLHTFTAGVGDGSHPQASLILGGAGSLYGVTTSGGPSDAGTVFRLETGGTGFALLHTFAGREGDGRLPETSLVLDGEGNLYGTTYYGGASDAGSVFALKSDGTAFALLHSFAGGDGDGKLPEASLILDGAGNLYGTTYKGGAMDRGTVFTLKTDGTGFALLHSFAGGAGDGRYPKASLVLGGNGSLYGTTSWGGLWDAGTVFTLTTAGTGFALLHTFAGGQNDGKSPQAALVHDGAGNLYGTTYQGGAADRGTVFTLRSDGTGFALLHSFAGGPSDGRYPTSHLVLDNAENLSGTTFSGGPSDAGVVFTLKTDGTGYRLLHTFAGGATDWGSPSAGLVLDVAGTLYGTAGRGGASDFGAVFSLKTDGTGFQIRHGFEGPASDGSNPRASLVIDAAGNLFGTTSAGGVAGWGTEFSLQTPTAAVVAADFTFSPGAPVAGAPVQFNDASTGGPTAWSWTFGDGGSSTQRHPSHTFLSPGTYQVTLSANNGVTADQETRPLVVAGQAGSHHPADGSANWRLEINEVTAYGAAWKQGQSWPRPPNPIPIDYLTNAGFLWKSGETYHHDPTRTPPFAPGAAAAPPAAALAASATPDRSAIAVRAFSPLGSAPDRGAVVTLVVTPDAGTLVYAVEDTPPAGWTVSGLADGGSWDAASGKVKWGPFFDDATRALSYTATAQPTASGSRTFAGVASFDGALAPVAGASTIDPAGARHDGRLQRPAIAPVRPR